MFSSGSVEHPIFVQQIAFALSMLPGIAALVFVLLKKLVPAPIRRTALQGRRKRPYRYTVSI